MADQARPGGDQLALAGRIALELRLHQLDGAVGQGDLVLVGREGAVLRPLRHPPADADLAQPVDRGVQVADGAGLDEAGHPVPEQLGGGELGGQPLVGLVLGLVERDQPLEDVGVPTAVVGHQAAGQRFAGDVDVAVDETRRDQEAPSVDDLARPHGRSDVIGLADGHDDAVAERKGAVAQDAPLLVDRQDQRVLDQHVDRRRLVGRVHHDHGLSSKPPVDLVRIAR